MIKENQTLELHIYFQNYLGNNIIFENTNTNFCVKSRFQGGPWPAQARL